MAAFTQRAFGSVLPKTEGMSIKVHIPNVPSYGLDDGPRDGIRRSSIDHVPTMRPLTLSERIHLPASLSQEELRQQLDRELEGYMVKVAEVRRASLSVSLVDQGSVDVVEGRGQSATVENMVLDFVSESPL
ncbi:hypothetical protein HKX48_005287 [Thoreauomyces humboldtii]|nr:hypothetical protein HKX48_005287 [Thoreauomyces humboldtii]